jgi:hypothetical protein
VAIDILADAATWRGFACCRLAQREEEMALAARQRIIWMAVIVFVLAAGGLLFYLASREQPYDPSFDTGVAEPAYRTDRPRVLYDEAHLNVHSADGGYKGFADLITNDGYDVQRNRDAFMADRLAGVAVLVIVGARGHKYAHNTPAFTESEIAAVDQWVRSGGSLLLITDHYPFGAAAEPLGRRLGVDVASGMVEDPLHHEPSLGQSHLIFSRANGLLHDHPITQGRNRAERIERVLTFTGTSLRGPAEGSAFLSLSDAAVDRPASAPIVEKNGGNVRVTVNYGDPVSAGGRAQGLALGVGKGRVVVLGEAGMLSAQRNGRGGSPVGMNFPGYDNRQLALNILHWLSRLL